MAENKRNHQPATDRLSLLRVLQARLLRELSDVNQAIGEMESGRLERVMRRPPPTGFEW